MLVLFVLAWSAVWYIFRCSW